jgi:hypothetical protein
MNADDFRIGVFHRDEDIGPAFPHGDRLRQSVPHISLTLSVMIVPSSDLAFAGDRETPVRIGLRGGGCSPVRTGLSLHFGELQGDFDEMQGGGKRNPAKSGQISEGWMELSLLQEQGGYRP